MATYRKLEFHINYLQMKNLLLLFASIIVIGCEKPEMAEPVQIDRPKEYVTFKIVGLYGDVAKQVQIYCGGYALDTVVYGNFTYKVPVEQRIMHSVMRVRTLQPISEKLIIEAQGMRVDKMNSCEWLEYEIKWTFEYDKY